MWRKSTSWHGVLHFPHVHPFLMSGQFQYIWLSLTYQQHFQTCWLYVLLEGKLLFLLQQLQFHTFPQWCMSYLLCNYDQGVPVLWEEIKYTPDFKCVIIRDEQAISVEVFPSTQRPAHPVKVHSIKVVLYLKRETWIKHRQWITMKYIFFSFSKCLSTKRHVLHVINWIYLIHLSTSMKGVNNVWL